MKEKNSLISFLRENERENRLRGYMPGHKGKPLPGAPELATGWDITEIEGADSLYDASGLLTRLEARLAALWGSASTCISAGGSTLCIQAMLAEMGERTVIASRTVHRAFVNACALLDRKVRWIFPQEGNLLSGTYVMEDVEAALREVKGPACLYVTSPDYTGSRWDIAALARLCRKYDAPLLVDNAHGAHLCFLEENEHPMALGADYCCDSLHKTLPALTGAALLHSRKFDSKEMKSAMQLFGSTSPSYLIMASIEAAAQWLEGEGRAAMLYAQRRIAALKESLPAYSFLGDDPLHLSIRAEGTRLAKALRARGVECEYADATCLVLLLSPRMEEADFERLECTLRECTPAPPRSLPPPPAPPVQVCSLREATFAPQAWLPVTQAEGRIYGRVTVPCPPGVPLLMSGERITKDWITYLQAYGIEKVPVLR